jgi:hypothetical protein
MSDPKWEIHAEIEGIVDMSTRPADGGVWPSVWIEDANVGTNIAELFERFRGLRVRIEVATAGGGRRDGGD